MAFSLALAENGTPPESIETTASVTFKPGTGITGSHLNVNAVVPGLEPRGLRPHRAEREGRMPRLAGPRGRRDHPRGDACLNRRRRGTRRVVVAGASGLIGSALVESLRADGVSVTTLVRRPPETAGRGRVADRTRNRSTPRCSRAPTRSSASTARASAGSRGPVATRTPCCGRASLPRARSRARCGELGGGCAGLRLGIGRRLLRLGAGRRLTEDRRAGRVLPRRPVRRMGAAALAAGDHARVAVLRTAPIVHREGVLKPLLLLTRFGVERADRPRHAGVAVDLARRRGARDPARHRRATSQAR